MSGINGQTNKEVIILLDTIQKSTDRIREILSGKSSSFDGEKSVDDLMEKSWDELFESGEIEILKIKWPEQYRLKFKKEFGSYPNP